MSQKCLILGANGQIGTELVIALRAKHGVNQVIASDVKPNNAPEQEGPFIQLDALDESALRAVVVREKIDAVYLMAAMLSATGEQHPDLAWSLNMNTLFHVLRLAKDGLISRIFWPSSIAVFGPSSPKENTPQLGVMEPSTVYGISKLSGEMWCQYYHQKYGVDVRSLRYPGLISHKSAPGGGTTDYAVTIFYEALATGHFDCYLSSDAALPMMYMDDAIAATLALMDAPATKAKPGVAYNLSAMSFSPEALAEEIKKHLPEFTISYAPDARQKIADSWPKSIDDSWARKDWGWKPQYDLSQMVSTMLAHLK
ncbi:MAG: NAD-dependent epimerase/dehydratase family protein [Flavobacteriaceae bacterium]|nr:NAD-dependent epimerase/dehydratase family protein [Flavobacteriaceae bacterium]MDP4674239.1 NAD-dependent epimerase/dehydratase family protein [Flavobacteriaceae bacterium]MDP4754092.1 NAD-dependent epimerase/dehydratase family protein [Flavobacteriaceae bacterium]